MNDDLKTPSSFNSIVDYLLKHCGNLQKHERLVVVCDVKTEALGQLFLRCGKAIAGQAILHTIASFTRHGEEPPQDVAESMGQANLIVGLTWFSMAHTQARFMACENGARYLSMPEYTVELLQDPSVTVDFRSAQHMVLEVAEKLTNGKDLIVRTKAGTDIAMRIDGRTGNACPGCVLEAGNLGSPPNMEANISPLEDTANGTVVVDGSIPCPEIGILSQPVTLFIKDGAIDRFSGPHNDVQTLESMFESIKSDKAYILAECGIGLNEKAKLSGIMLTDEGAYGCVHFGFGSNSTVGGNNEVSFHLDFVFRHASVWVDGELLLKEGRLCL